MLYSITIFRLLLEPQYVNHFKICLSIMNLFFPSNAIELVAPMNMVANELVIG